MQNVDWINIFKTTLYIISGWIAFILNELNIDGEIILWYVIAMCIDFLTGITKAKVLHSVNPVLNSKPKSHLARKGFLSKSVMLALPITIGILGNAIHISDEITEVSTTTLVIPLILAEVFSILGNIQAIRTGKEVEEFDAVTYVIVSLRKKILKTIDKIFDNESK
jgi:hypothetical protein